ETWGRAAALLEFLLAGGGAGIDQDVADAELFNEAEGFLAGAGADGEHADDTADAEDDAEGSEESAGLLGAQVGDGLAEVGEEDHRELAGGVPFGSACPTFEKRITKELTDDEKRSSVPRMVRVIGRGPSWRCRIVRHRI